LIIKIASSTSEFTGIIFTGSVTVSAIKFQAQKGYPGMKKVSRYFLLLFSPLLALIILCLPAGANAADGLLVKRAINLWNAGKYDEALQQLNNAIAENPDDAQAYEQRGNIHAFLNNFKRAIDDYDTAIRLRPNHALTYYSRGTIYTLSNNYEPAIKDYTKALQLRIGYYEAHFHRGTIYALQGNQQKAVADFSRVIELKPGYSEAYLYRGIAQEESGKYEEALHDLDKALEMNPRLESGYIHRGNIHGILGNKEKAEQDYRRANELNPYKSLVKSKSSAPKRNTKAGPGKIKIIANSSSKNYHLPGMKYYDKVKAYHRIVFYSEEEAIAAGYQKAPK
jgi:tetratricopeptide (TPR) repeat protein